MKKILGLDLGTTSIGWALVNEKEAADEVSSITKVGVRVVPLTVDEQQNFEKGRTITTNADRTLKRSMRRSLQRYKLRREHLRSLLKENGWISDATILAENGNRTTFETYRLRAKAATEAVSLEELARVLLMINKKRGYKSSRKAKDSDEGQLIDGMAVAMEMYEKHLTPGQYMLQRYSEGKRTQPDFYRSDLQAEFDRVWAAQQKHYPQLLTAELKENLVGKNATQTWAALQTPWNLAGIKRATKRGLEQNKENAQWRSDALAKQIGLEELAVVLQEINKQISASSGYLGAISDRSKELVFGKKTVGQYLMDQLDLNPHHSLKNQPFYRQDYMDEFERIWSTQRQHHPELTDELKHQLRDIVIFYQRPLRSQKGLLDFCEFESRQITVTIDGKQKTKTTGLRVCPKSSPLFQEVRLWETLNNLELKAPDGTRYALNNDQRTLLANELEIKKELKESDALKVILTNPKGYSLNYKKLEGHRTNAVLYDRFAKIVEATGHDAIELEKMPSGKALSIIFEIFDARGINTEVLLINPNLKGEAFYRQPAYRLWHLLYSYEGDNSTTGNQSLIDALQKQFGFAPEYGAILASATFEEGYGNLSAKALLNILPWVLDGYRYDQACERAGYNHSHSVTKEENDQRQLLDTLPLIGKGSLRNPVVEKILNQTVNVVNEIVTQYGRPDEIRIEMARELKKTAQQREEMTKAIGKNTKEYEILRQRLISEFGFANPSRNDIIRLRLYRELAPIGYKAPYSGKAISPTQLFSKEIDIEHIIPQARLFDDSFANKTLEFRDVNIDKSNLTALDYVEQKWGQEGVDAYKARVEQMDCSPAKKKHLLWREADIPSDFLNRDLTNSQYIAKKATEMLKQITRTVTPTTGAITDRLRDDWQLTDVMRELNWDKYDRQGLTETFTNRDGQQVRRIKDWTKRNDHRHHAMDALTIAFTKPSIIQYLNNLNARSDKSGAIYGIEQKELERDANHKLRFKAPFAQFRSEAKKQLEAILVSQKAKNKVSTLNTNTTRTKHGKRQRIQLTPRGQLHNETLYGSMQQYVTKEEKVGAAFNAEKIATVANKAYREALLQRLNQHGGDAKKAFTGANSLEKKPLFLNAEMSRCVPPKVKTVTLETIYTIRKEVGPDLKIDKVVDAQAKRLLQARLDAFGGDSKKAFSNLDENPIWLNKEKGIAIKSVTITGVSNAVALHDRTDHLGRPILDADGNPMPKDFVSTSNNHHVAVFRDADGNLQEHIVSFYEATQRKALNLPVIDKEYKNDEGWQFLFTMKQNECFVFPNPATGFDPTEVDLLDPRNTDRISPNLFRVQKFSTKDYVFRLHLETMLVDEKALANLTWKRLLNPQKLEGVVKVRLNHLGQIVQVGEY
ncbi:MAG: type II CRISPR RNA-guided endonuclease Cas9 [Bacteroidales bacterium]|nr:type II CRISPR RNA-guided endonuclease Cas9 [Bacteroidales bacterium]